MGRGQLNEPIEPVLLPQLKWIYKIQIKILQQRLAETTAKLASSGNFTSSVFGTQTSRVILEVGGELFSKLSKQTLYTYAQRQGRPSAGRSHLEKLMDDYITEAMQIVRKPKTHDYNERQFVAAEAELREAKEFYMQQMCEGYVDGQSWDNLTPDMQSAQIQHNYGDVITINTSGTQNQVAYKSTNVAQHNSNIQNDLEAVQALIGAIQSLPIGADQKSELSAPLELIIEEAEKTEPRPSVMKMAWDNLKARVADKAYDGVADAVINNALAAAKVIVSAICAIPA